MRTRFTRFSFLPLAAFAALVAGCGGGSSSPQAITVSGVAMAGPFSSGNVCAYRTSGATVGAQLACGLIDATTSGFSLTFSDYNGGVVVQIENNARYVDEATSANTTLTAPIRSFFTVGADPVVRLAITPLTEAALLSAGNFSDSKISAAAVMLATKFGLGTNNLFTSLPQVTPSTAEQLSYRVALGALSWLQAAEMGGGVGAENPSIYLTRMLAKFDGGAAEAAFNTAKTTAFNAVLANSSIVAAGSRCTFSNLVLTCTLNGTGTGTGTGSGTVTPPVTGTSTLTITTSVAGVTVPAVVLNNVPAPTDQASFCGGITNDASFNSLTANGGSVTINSCSFSNKVGKISATLTTTTPVSFSTQYSITYSYS